MSSTAFVSIAKSDMLFLVTEARHNTLGHETLAALPFPSPMDGREATRAPSPCRGCSSRRDKAGSRRHCNSSPSPAGGPGSAASSAATRRSEPASRWPVGGGTVWIPLQQTPAPQPQRVPKVWEPLKRWLDLPLVRLLRHRAVASLQVNEVHKSLLPAT